MCLYNVLHNVMYNYINYVHLKHVHKYPIYTRVWWMWVVGEGRHVREEGRGRVGWVHRRPGGSVRG